MMIEKRLTHRAHSFFSEDERERETVCVCVCVERRGMMKGDDKPEREGRVAVLTKERERGETR